MLEQMRDMRALGQLGGQRGGRARAKALRPSERLAIAKTAAQARWKPNVLVLRQPRNHGELQCFVAQYGNGHTQAVHCDAVAVLLRAVTACRRDPHLARMLPVFIWRAKDEIFTRPRKLLAVSLKGACTLGYVLELTRKISGLEVRSDLLHALRRKAACVDPFVLFHVMARGMFTKELARTRTSALAQSWKLVTGEPDESFEQYFRRLTRRASL
jgi:hypothetical protein